MSRAISTNNSYICPSCKKFLDTFYSSCCQVGARLVDKEPLELTVVSTDGGETWQIWQENNPTLNRWIVKKVREINTP